MKEVRLGQEQGYSVQLKVTMPIVEKKAEGEFDIDPDLGSFLENLSFLQKDRLYNDKLSNTDRMSSTNAETLNEA